MHYKLNFWDYQFKALIEFHMVEGNDFEWTVNGSDGSSVVITRLDYARTNDTDYLRYTFKMGDRREVVYCVDNNPKGGVTVRLAKVSSSNGEVQLLDIPNPVAEDVMCECYLTGVKIMRTFWFC